MIVLSYIFSWLRSLSELDECCRRIQARKTARRKWRLERRKRHELSDRENLEADIARIGGDFDKVL